MVATAHPLATEAALSILQSGGNAVDAAIAAQWVLNVVEPQGSGIGGGGFFLFYSAKDKQVYALDGREKAPVSFHPEHYVNAEGQVLPYKPDRITGGHSVGVPGTLMLLSVAHEKFGGGRYSFGELFDPAIKLAREGFLISEKLAQKIETQKQRLILFEESASIFLDDSGQALKAGTHLKQPDLAETFQLIKNQGVDVFYGGEIGQDLVQAVNHAAYRPGKIKLSDLISYEVLERDAIRGIYRGYEIYSMGPPSSGASTLIETLNILENLNFPIDRQSALFVHFFSEAQKIAFYDRNRFLGDPNYSDIPLTRLVSKEYAKERAAEITVKSLASEMLLEATPEGMHTSHLSIVDQSGNMVSFTTTIEHVFGSGIVVPGRGFFLNNELSDFDAEPFTHHAQLHPNAPEANKRPRSSMTPTLVFKNGKPFAALGSPGGSTIIGTVMNILVNLIDFKMKPEDAVNAPKILNRAAQVELEKEFYEDEELLKELRLKGHTPEFISDFGNAQAIVWDEERSVWVGVSDRRGEGLSKGL